MEKRSRYSIFFLLLVFLCVITENAFGDINYEIVTGTSMYKVISLFEPKGSNNFIGTIELRGKTMVRCDVSGNIIFQSPFALSGVGDIEPIYNVNGLIKNFNVFVGAGTTKQGFIAMDANLASFVKKSSWSSPITGEILYPAGSVRFSDGTSLDVSYSADNVYFMKTDTDKKPLWTQMKKLDISGGLNMPSPSVTDISVTKGAGDSVIIGLTCGDKSVNPSNVQYDLGLFNVNSDGINNCPPVKFDFNGLFAQDSIGDIVTKGNDIFVLGRSDNMFDNLDKEYFLKLDQNFGQKDIHTYAGQMAIADAAINPDGIIWIAGQKPVGDGNFDSLIGWINSADPNHHEFNYLNLGGIDFLQTIDWNPNGAIAGGSIDFTQASRVIYTSPSSPVPDPSTLVLLFSGLIAFSGVRRK